MGETYRFALPKHVHLSPPPASPSRPSPGDTSTPLSSCVPRRPTDLSVLPRCSCALVGRASLVLQALGECCSFDCCVASSCILDPIRSFSDSGRVAETHEGELPGLHWKAPTRININNSSRRGKDKGELGSKAAATRRRSIGFTTSTKIDRQGFGYVREDRGIYMTPWSLQNRSKESTNAL